MGHASSAQLFTDALATVCELMEHDDLAVGRHARLNKAQEIIELWVLLELDRGRHAVVVVGYAEESRPELPHAKKVVVYDLAVASRGDEVLDHLFIILERLDRKSDAADDAVQWREIDAVFSTVLQRAVGAQLGKPRLHFLFEDVVNRPWSAESPRLF